MCIRDRYQVRTEVKNVHKIANDERVVPREWVNEEGTYVTAKFKRYILSLIHIWHMRLQDLLVMKN